MNDTLKAAGLQCGLDIESLYKKYTKNKTSDVRNQCSNDNGDAPPLKMSSLDDIIICKSCHGLGFVKEHYNHQVKDVNCHECDGEGIKKISRKWVASRLEEYWNVVSMCQIHNEMASRLEEYSPN